MSDKWLFNLAEDDARSVYKDEQGIYHIDSNRASDECKKEYDVFLYDLHDNKFIAALRRFFNVQYSLFFSVKPSLLTKIFSILFLPFYPMDHYGSILDFGCSTGLFLTYLPNQWQKYGLELNTKAVEIAQRRGLNVTAGSLESFQSNIRFDVIRASHVLEHIKDHRKFFSAASNLLKPGGCLVIYTPNGDSFSRRLTGRFWSGFYEQTHFTIFNEANLIIAAKEFGFEPVFSSSYNMGTLGDSIVRACNKRKGSTLIIYYFLFTLFFPLSFLERFFNKGDALVVYLKKAA